MSHLALLVFLEGGRDLLAASDGKPLRLFDGGEISRKFRDCNVAGLRCAWMNGDVPEEYATLPKNTSGAAGGLALFSCHETLDDGSACDQTVESFRALRVHQRHTKAGSHGLPDCVRALVVSNECPNCRAA